MNKVILGLILAVCVLGMALAMLNERLGREPENVQASHSSASTLPEENVSPPETVPPRTPASPEAAAPAIPSRQEAIEKEAVAAVEALAPPQVEPEQPAVEPAENITRDEPFIDTARATQAEPEPAPVAPVLEESEAPRAANTAPAELPAPPPAPQERVQAPSQERVQSPAQERVQAPARERVQAPARDKSITRFVVFAREKGATVRISGNGPLNYKSMVLENPDRVVIDLDGDWKDAKAPGVPKNDLVSNVRVGKMGENTRIVIDLKEKPRVSRVIAAKNGDSVDIRVDR